MLIVADLRAEWRDETRGFREGLIAPRAHLGKIKENFDEVPHVHDPIHQREIL